MPGDRPRFATRKAALAIFVDNGLVGHLIALHFYRRVDGERLGGGRLETHFYCGLVISLDKARFPARSSRRATGKIAIWHRNIGHVTPSSTTGSDFHGKMWVQFIAPI